MPGSFPSMKVGRFRLALISFTRSQAHFLTTLDSFVGQGRVSKRRVKIEKAQVPSLGTLVKYCHDPEVGPGIWVAQLAVVEAVLVLLLFAANGLDVLWCANFFIPRAVEPTYEPTILSRPVGTLM